MKKVLLVLCMFSMFMLVGCESSSEDREILFQQMKKQNIISSDYKLIDVVTESGPSLESCKSKNYYIYENNDGKVIAVTYEKMLFKTIKYDHEITVYFDVHSNPDFQYLTSDSKEADCGESSYYKYSNGDLTDENKYDLDSASKKTYNVTVKKSLFSTKYIFE